MLLWMIILISKCISSNGLTGITTWMCLGLKSPFIDFKSEFEVLYNNNHFRLSQERGKVPFLKKSDRQDSLFMDPYKKIHNKISEIPHENVTTSLKYHSTLSDIDFKKPDLNNMTNYSLSDNDSLDRVDTRKYIIPLALKTISSEKEKIASIFHGTSKNIDDLKNHILMLQNLTINDKNFQSKFVVFPSLKKQQHSEINAKTQQTKQYESLSDAPTLSVEIITKNYISTSTEVSSLFASIMKKKMANELYKGKNEENVRDISNENDITQATTVTSQVFIQNDQISVDSKNKINIKKKKHNSESRSTIKNKRVELETMTQPKLKFLFIKNNGSIKSTNDDLNTTKISKKRKKKIKISKSLRSSYRKANVTFPSIMQRINRDTLFQLQNVTDALNENILWNKMWKYTNESNESDEKIYLNVENCYKAKGFSDEQKKICVKNVETMPALSRGARSAIQECQHQFKPRRWNCSIINDETVFGPVTQIGSAEMAFIYALASAGVTSFVARACRNGQLTQCGCSNSIRPKQLHEDWTWGGCGDDLEFGYKFSRMFIDIMEREKIRNMKAFMILTEKKSNLENEKKSFGLFNISILDAVEPIQHMQNKNKIISRLPKGFPNTEIEMRGQEIIQTEKRKTISNTQKDKSVTKARSLMNLHNNEVGRRAVINKSRVICKCHGLSGSCSLITCWKQLSSIREIGNFLKAKYDAATQVKLNTRGRLQVKDSRYKLPTALDLVFLEESPDWCHNKKELQWTGTHGRSCNKGSDGLAGCGIMCCGRGYNTKKIVVRDSCKCKFKWCCHVQCDTCVRVNQEFTCK